MRKDERKYQDLCDDMQMSIYDDTGGVLFMIGDDFDGWRSIFISHQDAADLRDWLTKRLEGVLV